MLPTGKLGRIRCLVRIGDVPEEEGVAGHGGAGGTAVLALDDLAKFFYCHLVAAHLDKRADDGAHQVAQEAVGGNGENPLVILLGPQGMGDAAIIGLHIGVEFREGCEVGVIHQAGGGLVHEVEIEVWWAFPAQGVTEGVLAGDGKVLVGAAGGVKAGMGIVVDGSHAVNGDVGRQQGIEAVHQAVNVVDGLLDVKVGNHESRIDTSVGAASACDGRGDPQERSQGLLKYLLHRGVVGLHLPSVEVSPSKTQSDKIPHLTLVDLTQRRKDAKK